jgi:hypothetical protein
VKLSQAHPKVPQLYVAPVRLEDWNRLNDTLQAITGYYSEDVSELSGELPEKLERVWVAPRFLQVMGIAPSLGRDFSPQEQRFGGPNAVLISDRHGAAVSTATQTQSARPSASAPPRGQSSASCPRRFAIPTAMQTYGPPAPWTLLLRRAGN